MSRRNWLLLAVGCGAFGFAIALPEQAWALESANEAGWNERLASSLSASMADGHLWVGLLAAWVGGLLTAFTPCVWPLVPITVRFFGGMQKSHRARVVALALTYVSGMALLYSGLGVAFASSGILFGAALANRWVVTAIALFCVAMGASMLGAFTLQLPSSWSTQLSRVGGQGHAGAFGMGLVSGLIAAPCTGPVLAVILAFVASSGQVTYGFGLMIAFSLGMGAPLLILAVVSGRKVPSGGVWMEVVKVVLAAAMFVVAIYFLRVGWPVVRDVATLVPFSGIAGLILIVAGLTSAAILLHSYGRKRGKALATSSSLLLSLGVALAVFGGSTVTSADPGVPRIAWIRDHEQALQIAQEKNRPLFIDITAEWCVACKELDYKTFIDRGVRAEATRFVAAKLDATAMDDSISSVFERYEVHGLPAVVFIDSAGNILKEPRVTGFVPPSRFLEMLRSVH